MATQALISKKVLITMLVLRHVLVASSSKILEPKSTDHAQTAAHPRSMRRRPLAQPEHQEQLHGAAPSWKKHYPAMPTRRKQPRVDEDGGPRLSNKYAYFGFSGRWRSHSNLTYALSLTDVTTLVPRHDILFALESAFRTWATVVPLTFTHVDDAYWEWADIKVSFLSGEHGDGQPFDGTLGVLGHSFAPEDGRMHLDIAEQWSVDVTSDSCRHVPATMDLQSVVLHEVGHLIGLGHSEDPGAAMFADIAPHQVKHFLSADDIEGAQSLYGSSQVYQVLQGVLAPIQGPSSGIHEGETGAKLLFIYTCLTFVVAFLFGVPLT